ALCSYSWYDRDEQLMFSWSELLLIAIVALIFIGPKELPQVLQSLGKAVAKLRRSADDFRRQFEDSMRDSGYGDLHKNIQDLRQLNPASQLKSSIDSALNQTYSSSSTSPSPAAEVPPPSEVAQTSTQDQGSPSEAKHEANGSYEQAPPASTHASTE